MSARVHIDNHAGDAPVGISLFEFAESLGVKVPTSCLKNGRCKECVVEVMEGMELLSPPVEAERHLQGKYRLSCCARVAQSSGSVRCHTMRRGAMRIERHAFELPARGREWRLDPAVTRDGDRVLLDGA